MPCVGAVAAMIANKTIPVNTVHNWIGAFLNDKWSQWHLLRIKMTSRHSEIGALKQRVRFKNIC